MAMTSERRKRVAVVGAGVVGLNLALEVQRRFPDANVAVIAHKFNGETLSDGAAGLLRPDSYIFGPNREVSQQWVNDSYSFYKNLLNKKDERCGINEVSGFMFSSRGPEFVKNHYLENCISDYRDATHEELQAHYSPDNNVLTKYGIFYTSMVIECKRFLPWALKKISDSGGIIIKRRIESLEELYGEYDVIFNCTGFEAKQLCSDVNVIPIRGQVIRVKAPWIKNFYYYDSDTYIIPSKDDGTVVLGGCRHFGSYEESVNERNTEEILEKCVNLIPSLKNALKMDYEIWVGLRPYRNKIRIEMEQINNTVIVHNYGHGGYGVTLAPGTAKYAVDLLTP
ncbi:D-aspartate oxidase [Sipha flava]|uniref:D-aspartate oxidase n=1 Tax=Sipha flava TaxID=143950 RepID=A0A2S2R6S0_9HEMI|nr:D-aspartate oxidase [Sipha flava]XP_025420565.1 D-aspartate oxidase [Sipha flava]XP_025420566.1 D-aspartate oxidase [Sipha flava]